MAYSIKRQVVLGRKKGKMHFHDIAQEHVGGNDGGAYLQIYMVIRPLYYSIGIRKIT